MISISATVTFTLQLSSEHFPLTSVFLDSEIFSAVHENFGTYFLSKRSSAAQNLLRKVFVKYQKNRFSGMDISFLGLAGRIKELL